MLNYSFFRVNCNVQTEKTYVRQIKVDIQARKYLNSNTLTTSLRLQTKEYETQENRTCFESQPQNM